MSDCGCKGHYHNGGCSDQNVIWWRGAPGIPVNPTQQEIDDQVARLKSAMSAEDQAKFQERMDRIHASANATDK
jgi:hypothetical protein